MVSGYTNISGQCTCPSTSSVGLRAPGRSIGSSGPGRRRCLLVGYGLGEPGGLLQRQVILGLRLTACGVTGVLQCDSGCVPLCLPVLHKQPWGINPSGCASLLCLKVQAAARTHAELRQPHAPAAVMYSSRQLPRWLPRRRGFRSRALLFCLPSAGFGIQPHCLHDMTLLCSACRETHFWPTTDTPMWGMVKAQGSVRTRCSTPALGSATAPAWQRHARPQSPADWRALAHRAPGAARPRTPQPRAQSRPAQSQPVLPDSAPAARQEQACCELCKRTAQCKHKRFRGKSKTHLTSNKQPYLAFSPRSSLT
jgi:hypothetical protein